MKYRQKATVNFQGDSIKGLTFEPIEIEVQPCWAGGTRSNTEVFVSKEYSVRMETAPKWLIDALFEPVPQQCRSAKDADKQTMEGVLYHVFQCGEWGKKVQERLAEAFDTDSLTVTPDNPTLFAYNTCKYAAKSLNFLEDVTVQTVARIKPGRWLYCQPASLTGLEFNKSLTIIINKPLHECLKQVGLA